MPPSARAASFTTPNRHALATILEASQTKSIIASRDIFDIMGTKLWARDQPVSGELQRKLLDRQLRNPLETCLLAEDGVTSQTLLQSLEGVLGADDALASLLRPCAAQLIKQVMHLPLHPVVQLLLTASQASRPQTFDHAVRGMALAGALMAERTSGVGEIRLAMLGGLVHDLGEMYIEPRFGDAAADQMLDFRGYQQLVVHPHVGHLLIAQLTDYPAAVARAVAEHHERLDGSGYPHGLLKDALSPLGRLLAVTETALAVLRGRMASLPRASIALRAVPGEFDLGWVGRIADMARAQAAAAAPREVPEVQQRLQRLDQALKTAQDHAISMAAEAETPPLKEALALAQHLLARLRAGWYASGLWSADALEPGEAAEVAAIEDELSFRLRSIERAARLRAGDLPPADARRLDLLCETLSPEPTVSLD